MATVLIEGVPFTLEEAADFARRAKRYLGSSPAVMHAAETLAVRVEHRVETEGGESLELTVNETAVAAAVLDEWLQAGAGSQAVRDLRHVLASR